LVKLLFNKFRISSNGNRVTEKKIVTEEMQEGWEELEAGFQILKIQNV
jgi:hypothetical protein